MVYGNFSNPITEDYPCNPIGQYGVLKLCAEMLLQQYSNRGLPYTIIRPSAVYGELDSNNRIVGKFLTSAIKGKELVINGAEEIADFTHVNDVARGIVDATLSNNTDNKIYNITCNKEPHTFLDVANTCIRIAKDGYCTINEKQTGPSRNLLITDKAYNDFNYTSQISVEDGIRQYANWLNKNTILWG